MVETHDWPPAARLDPETLGDRIRRGRRQLGMNQEEFGQAVGVSVYTVWRWETNYRPPQLKHLRRIAELTGIQLDYWIELA